MGHFVKDRVISYFPMTNSKWVAFAHFVKGSLSTPFPMTNSEWVTLPFVKGSPITSFSYDQQLVSDTVAYFMKGSPITCFPMTNSLWVTWHIFWKAVSSHVFLWTTGSEWHCTFSELQSYISFPTTNREWVTLHILWKAFSSHVLHRLTACEWHHKSLTCILNIP